MGNAFQASSETSSLGYEPTDPSKRRKKAALISVSKGNVIRASSEASPWGYVPTIRESAHHTRHRFTICTYVNSKSINLPPVEILFKPKPDGDSAFQKQQAMLALMREYNQNADSNLSETKLNSAIVMLDWYGCHRTAEIAAGHMLLLHGGGTTPFQQVNDIHVHARLKHYLKSLDSEPDDEEMSDAAPEEGIL